MKRTQAYVITANDSVEAVCLGDEAQAETIRDRLREEYQAWRVRQIGFEPAYRQPRIHWAVRTIKVLDE